MICFKNLLLQVVLYLSDLVLTAGLNDELYEQIESLPQPVSFYLSETKCLEKK